MGWSSRLGQNPNFYRKFVLEAPVAAFPHIHQHQQIITLWSSSQKYRKYYRPIQPSRKMARAQMRPWQVTPQSFLSEVFHQV